VSLPLPLTLPFHTSKVRGAFPLRSGFPGRAASRVGREESGVTRESSGRWAPSPAPGSGLEPRSPAQTPKGLEQGLDPRETGNRQV